MARSAIDDNHHKAIATKNKVSGSAEPTTSRTVGSSEALEVAIVDASGNQITTFGGSGGTAADDDSAFTAGSGSGTPMMGFVTSDSVDSGDVGVVGMLANRQQKVTLFDSSGVEITSFGGGTQYTEGDTDASITGTAMLMEGSANTLLPIQGTVADGLLVNLGSNNDVLATAKYNATLPTLTDGQTGDLQLGTRGSLHVELFPSNSNSAVAFGTDNADDVAVGATSTRMQVLARNTVFDGTAWDRMRGDSTDGILVNLGSNNDVTAAQSGSWSVTVNAGTNTIGNIVPVPGTAGGLSIFRSIDLDETEEEVKASAGQVYGYYIFNASTSVRYVKFYNATAANVTVGTTTPVLTLPIPAQSSGGVAANLLSAHGITFDTAITVAATTGLADNDTGAPGNNEIVINVWYK